MLPDKRQIRLLVICACTALVLSAAWAVCLWLSPSWYDTLTLPVFYLGMGFLSYTGSVPCLSAAAACVVSQYGTQIIGKRIENIGFIALGVLFTLFCTCMVLHMTALGFIAVSVSLVVTVMLGYGFLKRQEIAAVWTLMPCFIWLAYMTAAQYMIAMLN